MGYHHEFLQSGYYTYNVLLVGLAIGQLYNISWLSLLFLVISAILTFVLTAALANIFFRLFHLHLLSIPFVLVSALIYLAAPRFSNLYSNDLYAHGELWLDIPNTIFPNGVNGFFVSLGAIVFMPNIISGIGLALLIGLTSRTLLAMAIMGYYLGTTLQALFTGSFAMAFNDVTAFNYILIAMALGAVFNIPSWPSTMLACLGVSMATVLNKSTDVFWSQYNIPIFTLPFTMITLSMNHMLTLLHFPLRPTVFKQTPEETAEYFYASHLRFPKATTLHLPFLDAWIVYQGFNGQWTHQGLWKYAHDFVKKDVSGKTYQGEGKVLADYYCFQKEVCSPVYGKVIYATDIHPDNNIGMVDTINNWGNCIVIQDAHGYYVSLCHLSQNKVFVKVGDSVVPYQCIALSGNSGYSPEPHLHMQYQIGAFIATETLPYCFMGILCDGEIKLHATPRQNDTVRPLMTHPYYHQVTNFALDDKLYFRFSKNGRFIKEVKLTVKMALDGSFYFSHGDSRLYYGKSDVGYTVYHLQGHDLILSLLYQALPSMPCQFHAEASWQDFVPEMNHYNRVKREFIKLFQQLGHRPLQYNAHYHFKDDNTIEGQLYSTENDEGVKTEISFDPYIKFKNIQVGPYQLLGFNIKDYP